MKDIDVDYGPLEALIGCWKSNNGIDIAPEPDATETNDYSETLTFTAVGSVTNAEQQVMASVHYHQQITRTESGKPLHNQSGYWLWDQENNQIVQTLTIPRGVAVVASGSATAENGEITLSVATESDIAQTDFMKQKAKTCAYRHTATIKGNTLHYKQTTELEIYQKAFNHTDECTLTKV